MSYLRLMDEGMVIMLLLVTVAISAMLDHAIDGQSMHLRFMHGEGQLFTSMPHYENGNIGPIHGPP